MANDGFIEFLSPNALAELKKASEIVDALALKIEKISNFKAPTTPCGVNSASKQIIDDLKAQEAQLKAINAELIREEKLKQQVLATETKQANATKANIAQREAQRKASLAQQQSDEKAARAAERSALANQRLNDAYGQLNKRRNEAARTLQNLIASETASNAEIRKAQREFDILNGKVKKADQAIGKLSQANNGISNLTSGVTSLMSAFGISSGIYLAVDIAKNIFETTKQLQSLDMALRNVSGTQLIYQENMNFLSKVSEDFGIEIKGLQEQFTQFYVAAKDKLSAEQIRDIFKNNGFDRESRLKHINDVAKMAVYLQNQGIIPIVSLISPYAEARDNARKLTKDFTEIYVSTPLHACESRDVKGLYKKARAGEIKDFTGIHETAPYEIPENPELNIQTAGLSIDACVNKILKHIQK